MRHPLLRWLPAIVVPAAIAAGTIAIPLAAGAADLPVRTPEDVLRLVAASDTRSFSGTVEQTSELGLPDFPGGAASGGAADGTADIASALALLTGDHRARVYVDGPTRVRVQLLDRLAERDVIRDGREVWLYQSSGKEVTHVTLPERSASTASPLNPDATAPLSETLTPQALAQRFLVAVDPTTAVTLGPNTTVAGRDAYELVLTPRTAATLVGAVSIAVDGATGLPLRVQVVARGSNDPAFSAGFTSFSERAPAAAVFSFTPPAGATVTERALPADPGARAKDTAPQHPQHARPTVAGAGWDAIVSLPAGTLPASALTDPLFQQLTAPVAGGRALSTALVSVLVTDDGRVLAGAVPVAALQAAAR